MGISEKLQEAVKDYERKHNNDQELIKLSEFYIKMTREGLVLKKEYDLPPLDTIGMTAHRDRS